QRLLEVAAVGLEAVAGLGDARDEGADRFFAVLEFGGPDEVLGGLQLVGKMMKHEHPPTQPVGADLEPGAVTGKWVLAGRPARVRWLGGGYPGEDSTLLIRRLLLVVFVAIVEDHLEHPFGGVEIGSSRVRLAKAGHGGVEQERPPIAIEDALQYRFCGAARVWSMGRCQVDPVIVF